jgi:Protein of unknown function (DUF2577).
LADLVGAMKKAGLDAVEASKPVNVFFGNVVSVSPLKINVEQKMTLEAPQLILARNVTTYTIQMTVDHWTEDETEHTHVVSGVTSSPATHKHAYAGKKTFTVHNGLVKGDKVILIREQGGQRFIVIDRVGVML